MDGWMYVYMPVYIKNHIHRNIRTYVSTMHAWFCLLHVLMFCFLGIDVHVYWFMYVFALVYWY